METKAKTTFKNSFEEEVHEGLTAFPKYLSSKYFYDSKGDKLFQQIMELPEYYLTGCEYSILDEHKSEIADLFSSKDGFELIELGAGDGKKTKVLLEELTKTKKDFTYLPVDISQDVLNELESTIKDKWPSLNIKPQQGTYFKVLSQLAAYNKRKKVIFVLGSNIGNLPHAKAVEFLSNITKSMREGDLLFMGFDLKKEPGKILAAYNDSQGVTEAFNKNLLLRINKEMDANFDIDNFMHWPTYDPESGTTKSFLVSKTAQDVNINSIDLTVHFDQWESIHTEISQKYDDSIVEWLSSQSGLEVIQRFTDAGKCFADYAFRRKA